VIEQAGGQSLAVTCDVTRADDIKAALEAAVERFGRLDIAFNNAGIEQPIKPAHEITDDEWDRLVAVNLRGAFVAMKHEIELMLGHGGGAIVNTSSGAGVKGFAGQAAYAATKHGAASPATPTKAAPPSSPRSRSAEWASLKRSRPPSCGCAPTKRRSRSATRWSSTAARPPEPDSRSAVMKITRSSLDTQKGPADWFTGDAYIDAVAAPAGSSTFAAALVHFTPGARTAWHTHPHGQTILVTCAGRMPLAWLVLIRMLHLSVAALALTLSASVSSARGMKVSFSGGVAVAEVMANVPPLAAATANSE
jgi:short subunit dehydrogenase